ncbi:hypothetical protein [Polyangium sorediatum]|uniref:Uncharacterized protein n=1 Tax=Polyangium sorediatum TaxID=889274 RepID=A0ABT6NUV7_9BACT|nr:hypothetical protein [Polyangium sorediatum]MDI1432130.1 hypothetical protein [Polyangium sorediatum]
MPIVKCSPKIDANQPMHCAKCQKVKPWDKATLDQIEAKLKKHNVFWPHLVIMHGYDLPCGDALDTTSRRKNHYALTLYVVATDAHGKKATKARVFATSAGYYVGMDRILNGTAF